MRRKLVVGNWKMNASRAANTALLAELRRAEPGWACDVTVCPPFPYLAQAADAHALMESNRHVGKLVLTWD